MLGKIITCSRLTVVSAFAISAVLVSPMTANAATPYEYELEAGVGCPFPLRVQSDGSGKDTRVWEDSEGDVVRTITAGKGSRLTFTNLDTEEMLSLKPNGAAQVEEEFHPDGSYTVRLMGHTVVSLFPSDVPAGPSTTLHIGRVVIEIDADGVWRRTSVSGRQIDICEALS